MAGSIQFGMRGLVTRLLVVCASFASIMGLLLQIGPPLTEWRWWNITLMAFGTFLLLAFVVTEFRQRNRYRVYRRSNLKAIRRYMRKWIEPGGRVAIWTRDLTWATEDDGSLALLTKKAENNELILCIAVENELSRGLPGRRSAFLAICSSRRHVALRSPISGATGARWLSGGRLATST